MTYGTCAEVSLAYLARLAELDLQAKSQPHIVTVAEALESERKARQVEQGDWANLLGIHPGTYQAVLKGEDRLPMNAVRRAYALGVSADALLQPSERRVPTKGTA